jgi:preprotein translocase subunit SecD
VVTRPDPAVVPTGYATDPSLPPGTDTPRDLEIADVARAEAGTGWVVAVDLRKGADGEDLWNALAGSCYNRSAECPLGQLAIELDGVIISAPTVQTPTFAGTVQISGVFTEDEARQLARVLNSGALPVLLDVVSVQEVDDSPTSVGLES